MSPNTPPPHTRSRSHSGAGPAAPGSRDLAVTMHIDRPASSPSKAIAGHAHVAPSLGERLDPPLAAAHSSANFRAVGDLADHVLPGVPYLPRSGANDSPQHSMARTGELLAALKSEDVKRFPKTDPTGLGEALKHELLELGLMDYQRGDNEHLKPSVTQAMEGLRMVFDRLMAVENDDVRINAVWHAVRDMWLFDRIDKGLALMQSDTKPADPYVALAREVVELGRLAEDRKSAKEVAKDFIESVAMDDSDDSFDYDVALLDAGMLYWQYHATQHLCSSSLRDEVELAKRRLVPMIGDRQAAIAAMAPREQQAIKEKLDRFLMLSDRAAPQGIS
jgi:hypothetical protein